MDKLKEAAVSFEKLLDTEYKIIVGRKNKLENINIKFDKTHFVHLSGLHKLKDLSDIRTVDREKIFDKIINDEVTQQYIEKSIYYNESKNRINSLAKIESLIDTNELIFKYISKFNKTSKIEAEYLLSVKDNCQEIYVFLDKEKNTDFHFCRSFFPKDKKDYTAKQPHCTLLYKEKISLDKREIQFNKLYSYKTISEKEYNRLENSDFDIDVLCHDKDKIDIRYMRKDEIHIRKLINSSND